MRDHVSSRRGVVLLVLGAVVGIGLAGVGLLGPKRDTGLDLPDGAVARINGQIIRSDDYERTLKGLASDRRDGIDDAQRRQVLDRLIDEELLVQRGLELGFARKDRRVRADLTQAVIASVAADQEDRQPTDEELRTFYDVNRDFFAQPGRLRVRQIFCRVASAADDAAALARAQDAVRRLRAGEGFGAVQAARGDQEISPLPDALLPPAKLMDYLGPTALHAALALGVGEVSEPVRSNAGYQVLQVVERQADTSHALAEIKPQVLAEFRRRNGERALRAYLDDLRARAEVRVTAKLP
ncbi:MAG TPA: peptidylprolyl isomerase [Candidatus Acidoferrales bacterium]|nr:peptidylprolyl isomerase [Candidatus Acidoferrales bacterium]